MEIEFEGTVHEFPDDFTDADIAKALKGSRAPAAAPAANAAPNRRTPEVRTLTGQGADNRTAATRLYQDYVAKPLTGAVSSLVQGRFSDPSTYPAAMKDVAADMARDTKAKADAGAEFVVPQTPTQAGIVAGTLGAGVASRAVSPGMAALSRITGGTIGGGVGGGLQDESLAGAAKGAATGLVTTGLSEGAGALLSKALRSGPGAKRAIADEDAVQYATEMARQSPALRTAGDLSKSPSERLRSLAAGEGQARLGAAKELATQQIESGLKGKPGTFLPPGRINMPSQASSRRIGVRPQDAQRPVTQPRVVGGQPGVGAAQQVETQPAVRGAYGEELVPPVTGTMQSMVPRPAAVAHQPTGQTAFMGEGTQVAAGVPVTVGRSTMTFREANDVLSEIGARAFSKNPADRTFQGIDQRRLYGEVFNEIKRGLDEQDPSGALTRLFEQAQREYAAGMGFMKHLQAPNAFRSGAGGLQFNTPAFQSTFSNPKKEVALRTKLGDAGFERLRDVLLRGGKPGDVDVLAPGSGGMLQASGEIMRGKGGATQLAAFLPRTFFPNAGSHYAGVRQPYALPPQLQTIIDMVLQRGAGRAVGE